MSDAPYPCAKQQAVWALEFVQTQRGRALHHANFGAEVLVVGARDRVLPQEASLHQVLRQVKTWASPTNPTGGSSWHCRCSHCSHPPGMGSGRAV